MYFLNCALQITNIQVVIFYWIDDLDNFFAVKFQFGRRKFRRYFLTYIYNTVWCDHTFIGFLALVTNSTVKKKMIA